MTLSLVRKAKDGDKDALVAVIRSIQDRIYGLAIRMLWRPADAEDATQEILVKIITHLASFREECAFDTWVYRVACNHLLTTRKRRAELMEITFEDQEAMIERGLAAEWTVSLPPVEQALVVEETMIACIQGMLLSLNRELRMAYILGEVFDMSGVEAAAALDITPVAFRKRLSRARTLLRDFMQKNCGLIHPDNPCTCSAQAARALETGWVNREKLRFVAHPQCARKDGISPDRLLALDELERVRAVFRGLPDYAAPDMPGRVFEEFVQSAQLRLFRPES